jgi:outer membrane protein OmpA-like peptidoglycan-associated protein
MYNTFRPEYTFCDLKVTIGAIHSNSLGNKAFTFPIAQTKQFLYIQGSNQPMKKLLIAFTLISIQLVAQKGADNGFARTFEANEVFKSFKWDGEDFTTRIVDGFLELEYKTDNSIFIADWADIDWKKPFSIKTAFIQKSGKPDKGHGILFGGTGIDNAYVFMINNTGNYTFFKYEEEKFVEIQAWTGTPHILKGKPNLLELKQKDGVYEFYINSKLTYTHEALPFYGFDHGYFVDGPSVVHSHFFSIIQKQTENINLVNETSKFGNKIKLSSSVNSENDELCPLISFDERTLYVARKKASYYENLKDDDEIWYSTFNVRDSTWGKMKNIGKPLNNNANNFIQYVSPDNNRLIVGNIYGEDGEYLEPGYSMSYRTANGWSMPQGLNIKNYYNKSNYNELCLAPSGEAMLLTLYRDDTHGFKDIYVSFLRKDSSWTEPKNIGPVVNTFANETSPFIAADGVTMYFSSPGHPGYGSNDIFMCKRLDDSWTKWTKPKNLGPMINTVKWDAYYSIPASGKTAYLVGGNGEDEDIYTMKQPVSARPEPVVLVKGEVYNSQTKKPMGAVIYYSELGSKKIIGHVNSDPKTGAFMLALPKGKRYSISAFKQDFLAVHENTDLITLKAYEEKEIDLYLAPVTKGQKVVLNNLFFKANTADILPESHEELDKIVDLLKLNRKLKIEVAGHTSKNNSTAEWNLNLSSNRANSVKNYFVEKGIPEERIIAKGYGNSKPILIGMDEVTLAKNRRVELEILEH